MIRNKIIAITLIPILLGACAKRPDEIKASYISPMSYQGYSCNQLGQEFSRITRKITVASDAQNSEANGDAVAVGSAIIFWPALFFLMGSDQEAEIARLKGEIDAVEQVSIGKNCITLLKDVKKVKDALNTPKKTKTSEKHDIY